MPGPLPLQIVDQPGGAVIRCLCGRELASIRRTSTAARLGRPGGQTARSAHAIPGLSPDLTAYGLAIMVAHAKGCRDVPASWCGHQCCQPGRPCPHPQ